MDASVSPIASSLLYAIRKGHRSKRCQIIRLATTKHRHTYPFVHETICAVKPAIDWSDPLVSRRIVPPSFQLNTLERAGSLHARQMSTDQKSKELESNKDLVEHNR